MDGQFETPKSTDERSLQRSLNGAERLSADWAEYLDTDTTHDVDFQCNGRSTTKAHRLIVSVRSPVLAKMLQGQMVKGTMAIIKIEDMDPGSLRLFVRFLYTGKLDKVPTFETAMVLYKAAFKYQVRDLARQCAQSLIESLTVENACDVLDVAQMHSDSKFMEEVTFFILEKRVPMTTEYWIDFCQSHLLLVDKVLKRYWDTVHI